MHPFTSAAVCVQAQPLERLRPHHKSWSRGTARSHQSGERLSMALPVSVERWALTGTLCSLRQRSKAASTTADGIRPVYSP